MRAIASLLLGWALASCAPHLDAADHRALDVAVRGATFRIEYLAQDEASAQDVAEALAAAVPRAQRWGLLRVPVTIRLLPSHEALEHAARRPGHEWLRAWARADTVDLQSPSTWSPRTWAPWTWFRGPPSREAIEELLAHELTHCAMYQAASAGGSWPRHAIPLWFREGMASVTAAQDPPPERLRTILGRPLVVHAGQGGAKPAPSGREQGDPLTDPDPLYRSQTDLVYGTAHLAFQFLLARYGSDRIRAILAAMGEGSPFPEAFERSVGIPLRDFEADFRRYVAWKPP